MSKLKELFTAVRDDDLVATRALLKENSSLISLTDTNDNGVMHKCATYGSGKMMEMLISEFNGNFNEKTFSGSYTPAMLAARVGNYDVLYVLSQHKADFSLRSGSNSDVIDFLSKIFTEELPPLVDKYQYDLELVGDNDCLSVKADGLYEIVLVELSSH